MTGRTEKTNLILDSVSNLLPGERDALYNALHSPGPVSIRINPDKYPGRPNLAPVPWSPQGYYLPERPLFALDPLWHGGAYYVQEASSMFLSFLLRHLLPDQPLRALDLCAAPGGKSTLMATELPAGSLLIANEMVRSRASILSENIIKWGKPGVWVSHNEPRAFAPLENYFDLILVDAPCSGEGLIRRDPDALDEWSPAQVKQCVHRQQHIFDTIWPALKPGGWLLYSTCTFNPDENEHNLRRFIEKTDAKARSEIPTLAVSWGILTTETAGVPAYRFFPHRLQGEGFFITAIQKPGEPQTVKLPKIRRNTWLPATREEKQALRGWLKEETDQLLLKNGKVIHAMPAERVADFEFLNAHLKLAYGPVPVAEPKGKEMVPRAELAFYTELNPAHFHTSPLSLEEALRYLRKEELLPESIPGWNLARYQNVALGWFKRLPQRINNYYPVDWRLRMQKR